MLVLALAGCATAPEAIPTATPAIVPVVRSAGVLALPAMTATPSPSPAAPPTPTATSTPVERPDVVVWWPADLWPASESPASAVLQAQIQDARDMLDLTIQVRERRLDGTGGILSALRAAKTIAPAAMPDLILIPRQHLSSLIESGLLVPLDDLLRDTLERDFFPPARALGRFQEAQYGIAYTLNLQHIVYRESTFSAPPSTLSAVLESGQPIAFTTGSPTALIQYVAAGGRLVDENGLPVLDEAPLLAVLEFYEQAAADGLLDNSILEYQSPTAYWDNFLRGGLGLAQVDAVFFLSVHQQTAQLRAAPIPTLDGRGLTTLDGWLWVMTATDAARQPQAAAFLDWMLRVENQAAFTEAMRRLPSQRPALRLAGLGDYADLVEDLLDEEHVIPASAISSTAATSLQNALVAVLNRTRLPADAAAEAVAGMK